MIPTDAPLLAAQALMVSIGGI
ncbi:MAG: hypothetical protein QG584_2195, partial [Pseudomonadota bacterium]|nr:hypothetical protein [Pseudomonadota bacterium]